MKILVIFAILLIASNYAEIALHGAGTTNPSKFFWKMMEDMETQARVPLQMTYRAVGSSTGIKEFINEENGFEIINDFGSGDLPIPNDKYTTITTAGHNVVHFPIAIGAVSIFFNIPVDTIGSFDLDLDACLLARIFSRDITTWGHEDIVERNPSLADLVDVDIKVVHRVFGSSSTSGLTQYLEEACPTEWLLGSGSTITWPVGTYEAQGSGSLVEFLVDNEYSIGYLEAGHGHARNLQEVSLLNKDGNWVTTLTADVGAAATEAISRNIIPDTGAGDFSGVSLINLEGADTWPITLFTYVYVRQNLTTFGDDRSALLVAFLEFILHDDNQETMAEIFRFTKLPPAIQTLNTASLGLLELPADHVPFAFETSSSTQQIIGAGERIISGKRNRYVDVALVELFEDFEVLDQENNVLRSSLELLETNYQALLERVEQQTVYYEELNALVTTIPTEQDKSPFVMGIIGLVFGIIALVVSIIVSVKLNTARV